jgi:hypothetical protein
MLKEVVDFIDAFQILPRHVSANACLLQGVVGALQATQAMSVLWAYTDYDPPVWPVVVACPWEGS